MDVHGFLGFPNYYHHFIKGYPKVVQPLYALISGDNASQKNKPIQWTWECEKAFCELKELCTYNSTLAFADLNKPFKLHTDASAIGNGTILYEEQNVQDKIK